MPNFGRLEIVDLRANWEHEDDHFTPWLSENLTLLNNVLNMNLECIDKNVEVGRYACDLLCRNMDDHSSVVIENQLNAFDHDHLGKALVYAAGLDARTIVWIAKDFTNEHRKTLDSLNERTHDSFQFFGVQLEVIQIDDSRPAPKFNVIVKPDSWVPPSRISNDYWRSFKQYLEQQESSLEVLRWHGGTDYLGFYLGYDENDGQYPQYWISAGRSNGFISANFCMNKGQLPDSLQRLTGIQQCINQKFSAEFEEEPQWPGPNPYTVVGVSRWLGNQVNRNSEFEWLRERLEKLEKLFKQDGEIHFLSDC